MLAVTVFKKKKKPKEINFIKILVNHNKAGLIIGHKNPWPPNLLRFIELLNTNHLID